MNGHFEWPVFLFLSAATVAVFTFITVMGAVGARTAERIARERFALLRTLAEQQGDNARQVLELLRKQEEKKEARERDGMLLGGAVTTAVGVALSVMIAATSGGSAGWTVGLIPMLIGIVLLLFARFRRPAPVREP
jgi:hypothetical protein